MLCHAGFIARYTFQYATMYALYATNAQRAGALIQFDDADAHFAGCNRHCVEHPSNLHRQVALVRQTLNANRVARISRLIAEIKRYYLRSNCGNSSRDERASLKYALNKRRRLKRQ